MSTLARYVCPGCAIRVKTPQPVPAGRHIKCPRCSKVFAVPATPQAATQRPKETKLAAAARETKLVPPAKETKLVGPAKPQAAPAPANEITCPKCAGVFRTPGPSPVGRSVRCPACTTVFLVTAALARRIAPARATPQAAPARKKTIIEGRPVFTYVCPGCKVALKSETQLPPGKQIKCPRCERIFGVPGGTVLAKPQATALAKPQAARPTKLAPAAAKPQAAQPARPTKLAPAQPAKPTKLAGPPPVVKPPAALVVRLPCPGCQGILKLVGKPPPGASLTCPRCKRTLRLSSKTQMAKAVAKPQAVARPQAVAKPQAAQVPRGRGLDILALVVMFGLAFGLIGFYTHMKGWWGQGIPRSAWALFTPPDGRCEILMPGTPEVTPARVHGEGIVTGQRYVVKREAELAAFLLIVSDRDATVTGTQSFDQLYAPVREYILSIQDGEVIWEDDIMHGSHAGKELQIKPAEGGLLIARVYLVRGQPHDRLYILVAVGPWTDSRKGDAAKFFGSFKIDPGHPVHRPREDRRRIRTA
jgi:DNA-directed RNA polymerase subunit RPC12/RpoP